MSKTPTDTAKTTAACVSQARIGTAPHVASDGDSSRPSGAIMKITASTAAVKMALK